MTVNAITRRAVLAAGLAAAGSGLARAQAILQVNDVDVAIVGGGAAGIAAARSIVAAGRTCLLIEAAARLGGRARTETPFGMPFDLGAAQMAEEDNPLVAAAKADGRDLVDLPASRRLYVDGREARDSAYDAFAVALGRARRAIAATADAGRDVAAARALPDLGPWGPTVEATLGPLGCGRTLANVSAVDFARRESPPGAVGSAQGIGALLEQLGAGLNLRVGTRVTRIDASTRGVTLEAGGTVRARVVIVALPVAVLAAGAVRFGAGLPARLQAAFPRLPSGLMERVGFLLPGNPLVLQPDETVLARASAAPAAVLQARVGGTDLHVLTFGADVAASIAANGETTALKAAQDVIGQAFGAANGARITRVVASRWSTDPLVRGAMAVAVPGAGAVRRLFAEPAGRLVFAGEYTHETLWGTLAGAWSSGERAADQALRLVGGPS